MTQALNIDLDDAVSTLNSISDKYPEGSKEREVIEFAQAALLYTRHLRKQADFARYHRDLRNPSRHINVSHEFGTREEADTWLSSARAQEAELVKIAGKGFQVARLPGRLTFIDRPLQEEEEHPDSE